MLIDIRLENILPGAQKPVKVLKVYVEKGSLLKAGDPVLDVEANKGTTSVRSSVSGKVETVLITAGDMVTPETILAKVEGEQRSEIRIPKDGGFNYFGSLIKPSKQELESQITVIGGGPGGYVAAIKAAQLGAKVVLVEKDSLGGTCLNRGCIPTKCFVRSAQIYNNVKDAARFGINAEKATVDMAKVVARKNAVVNQLVNGIKHLINKNQITLVAGSGQIKDETTVLVQDKTGETTIKTQNIIIATGSMPVLPPIPGSSLPGVMNSDQALQLEKLPHSMVIVGGGVIGMEFAYIFANFGVKVSVIEYFDRCLAQCDDDICAENARSAAGKGIRLYTGAKVDEILQAESGECLVSFIQSGTKKVIAADKVLLAVGRKPYYEGLGLENLPLTLTDNQGIQVNGKMQTNIPTIYAIGDVTNRLQLAHVASHQALVAANNIMGIPCEMDYAAVPSAIFTDPEIAIAGQCERSAQDSGLEIAVGKFPLAANGKALTYGETNGFIKLITDKATGRIIGGSIAGLHATDLIGEITVAIKNHLTAEQIIATIHAHPTTAEVIHEAALATRKAAIHFVE